MQRKCFLDCIKWKFPIKVSRSSRKEKFTRTIKFSRLVDCVSIETYSERKLWCKQKLRVVERHWKSTGNYEQLTELKILTNRNCFGRCEETWQRGAVRVENRWENSCRLPENIWSQWMTSKARLEIANLTFDSRVVPTFVRGTCWREILKILAKRR